MAKRIIKWTLVGSVLKLWKADVEINENTAPEAEFNLVKIYPTFTELTDVQKQVIVYGAKQKLADSGSAEKEVDGKVQSAEDTWKQFLEGKWTGERTNATGAAENKKIVSGLKEKAKVVSFEGLTAKKLLTPEQFTEEDQAKLDEFIARMAKEQKKPKK